MSYSGFDTTITLNNRQLANAGMFEWPAEVIAIIRQAIETALGAGWIDVAAQSCLASVLGWVIV